MSKKRKYIPLKIDNPAVQVAKLKKVLADFERAKQEWEMEIAGIKNHFAKITNFTSHDVKNAIQNMDAVVSTLDIDNVTYEHIDTIKNCLKSMRISLDNFYKLSFEGQKVDFTLLELAKIVELLNKVSFNDAKIKFTNEVANGDVVIHQPFHGALQVLNNLMINSITSFAPENADKRICIKYAIESNYVVIKISDNASKIPIELKEKIFEIYFSTTGGSGIGLAHAAYILEKLQGSIDLYISDEQYCTNFIIKFPIKS